MSVVTHGRWYKQHLLSEAEIRDFSWKELAVQLEKSPEDEENWRKAVAERKKRNAAAAERKKRDPEFTGRVLSQDVKDLESVLRVAQSNKRGLRAEIRSRGLRIKFQLRPAELSSKPGGKKP